MIINLKNGAIVNIMYFEYYTLTFNHHIKTAQQRSTDHHIAIQ